MKLVLILLYQAGLVLSSVTKKTTSWGPWGSWGPWAAAPIAIDTASNIVYQGLYQSDVEAFLGIQYGQDTSGQNRFKSPQPYSYTAGSTVLAQAEGDACPQPLGAIAYPLYLSNITSISENCLLLNVKRPNGTTSKSKLPVMVFIHGGSFYEASKDELTTQPSGLILESIANGYPVMHVSMNYRLGIFGFAQSDALKTEGSENAGLKDQRLALDWVNKNIAYFGGDPDNVTIFGQSSGGLAIGMQIMAYGASKPVPFQRGICESQALEGGITGNFTRVGMDLVWQASGCNTSALDSAATVSCLRALSTQQLLDLQINTYSDAPSSNLGDVWLPVVDGDFLPEAPSVLINKGRFANVSAMIGWTAEDANPFVDTSVRTAQDSEAYLAPYLPGFNSTSLQTLYNLYPVSDFSDNPAANLTAPFYRTGRAIRDIVFVCMAMWYGEAISTQKGQKVYLYEQNQTFLTPALTYAGLPGLGSVHTSEFAYVFGNLSHYNVDNFPFLPNASDYALLQRESRSWSSFAALDSPSLVGKGTLQGWGTAYTEKGNNHIYVIGGGQEGLFAEANGANAALNAEKLQERCAFLNAPDIIVQLGF